MQAGGGLVFHRPDNSLLFQRIFRRQRLLLTRMVADCDDLVFDPDLPEFNTKARLLLGFRR